MEKNMNLVRTITYLSMLALFTILIFAYFNEIFMRNHSAWPLGFAYIIVLVIVDYLTRKYMTNLLIFFGIYIAMFAIAIALPYVIMDKIIMAVIAFAYFIMAMGFWKIEINERTKIYVDIPLAAIAVFIVVYVHSMMFFSDELTILAYIGGVLFFLLFYTREYLDRFYAYTRSGEKFTQEVKNTYSTNLVMVLFFDFIAILGVLVTNLFFTDSDFNIFGKFFKWILKLFFGLFPSAKPQKQEIATTVEETTKAASQTDTVRKITELQTETTSGDTAVGNFFYNFMLITIAVAITLILIIVIYRFIKTYLRKTNKFKDEVIKLTDETINKMESNLEVVDDSELKIPFFLSNSEKIRRYYINRVNNFKKHNPNTPLSASLTPTEIKLVMNKYDGAGSTKNRILTGVYEEAKYSDHEMTRKHVQTAKENA